MLTIYLTRHGQDEDNKNGLLNGHRDSPLTDLGKEQARSLAQWFKNRRIRFDAVYSSPLQRAYKTAELVSKITDSPRPVKMQELIERDFGFMTGRPIADIPKLCLHIIKADLANYFLDGEGVETFPKLLERAQRALQKLHQRHDEGNILIATHGDFGKMLYAAYYKLGWEEVLKMFHFGNSDVIVLSPKTLSHDAIIRHTVQRNL